MKRYSSDSESGTALLMVTFIVLLLFGITGPVLMVTLRESRAVEELARTHDAFYLAEAGLAAAKYELCEQEDPDANGVGNAADETSTGSYGATAQDLGGGIYRLSSQGTAGNCSSNLQAVVQIVTTSRFPEAAISVIGDVHDEKFKLKRPQQLYIDGGDAPAWLISDAKFFHKVVNTFRNAIEHGHMSQGNLNGYQGDRYQSQGDLHGHKNNWDNDGLPIVRADDYAESLGDLSGLYNGIVRAVEKEMIPAATRIVGDKHEKGFQGTYGTPTEPAVVYLMKDVDLDHNANIQGYGTLIVSRDLNIKEHSSLNWVGDVIVIGDVGHDAKLKIEDSQFNVTGNLLVLGEAKDNTSFEVKKGGNATINGAFFVGSEYTDKHDGKAKLKAENESTLTINGVLTMLGKKVEFKINDHVDFNLNGMMQIGYPATNKWNDDDLKVKMEFKGDVSIIKDDAMIYRALDGLYTLGMQHNIPDMSDFLTREAITLSWWPTHE